MWSVLSVTSPIIFFLEVQLAELEGGRNVATILEEGKVLQKNLNPQVFTEILEAVGRTDLAKKLEIFIYPCK